MAVCADLMFLVELCLCRLKGALHKVNLNEVNVGAEVAQDAHQIKNKDALKVSWISPQQG